MIYMIMISLIIFEYFVVNIFPKKIISKTSLKMIVWPIEKYPKYCTCSGQMFFKKYSKKYTDSSSKKEFIAGIEIKRALFVEFTTEGLRELSLGKIAGFLLLTIK